MREVGDNDSCDFVRKSLALSMCEAGSSLSVYARLECTSPLDMTRSDNFANPTRAKFFFEGEQKFFVKGVTYGPFKPDADGNYLGPPEQVDADLALMREVRFERRADLSFAAALVSRSLRCGGDARSGYASVGKAHRVSA